MADEKKQGQKTVARDPSLVRGIEQLPVRSAMSQLLVFVLDVSPSMSGPKLDELSAAALTLHSTLNAPVNRGAFFEAMVVYANQARLKFDPKPTADVRDEEFTFAPNSCGDGTNITSGLKSSLDVIERARGLRSDWAKPVVLLMTDGEDTTSVSPEPAATAVKMHADLLCVGFGANAKMDLLKRLATSPAVAFHNANGAELRRCFQNVGATMSRSRGSNQGVAAILGQGGVVRG